MSLFLDERNTFLGSKDLEDEAIEDPTSMYPKPILSKFSLCELNIWSS